MNYVQSYIANISFPISLDELYGYGGRYNVEQILGVLSDTAWKRGAFCENDSWTAPRWAKHGGKKTNRSIKLVSLKARAPF